MPTIGESSPEYPHGYGFCQCGCGSKAKLLRNGLYSKYADFTHHPSFKSRQQEQKRQPYSLAVTSAENAHRSVRWFARHSSGLNAKYTVADELTRRYLDLAQKAQRLEIHVQQLQLEIEFAISFIGRCWSGDPSSKQVLMGRLQAVLASQKGEQGAPPNGGPAPPSATSGATEEPPSLI